MNESESEEKKSWHSDIFPTEAGFISIYGKAADPDAPEFEYGWGEYYEDTD